MLYNSVYTQAVLSKLPAIKAIFTACSFVFLCGDEEKPVPPAIRLTIIWLWVGCVYMYIYVKCVTQNVVSI